MNERLKLCVLASGKGTDLQSVIDGCESKVITSACIALVISNVPGAYALERAMKHGIKAVCIPHKGLTRQRHEESIAKEIKAHGIGLVVLAGYIRVLTPRFFELCEVPVVNIHPCLLPLFGGKGWYGERVHQAVIASGARYSGCTVHVVTPDIDAGPIIVQKVVQVYPSDTWESLAERVLAMEHRLLPFAIELMASGRARLIDGRVCIDDYAGVEREIASW